MFWGKKKGSEESILNYFMTREPMGIFGGELIRLWQTPEGSIKGK